MKTFTICILSFLITSLSFAQAPDKVLARVNYTYINTTDTIRNQKTRAENMMLFIGKNASLYTSYDRIRHEVADEIKTRAKIAIFIPDGRPRMIVMDQVDNKWMTKTNHVYFFNEKKHFTKENVANQDFLLTAPLADIRWKITKDTLSIAGVPCQKAMAIVEGKNWTAWFAPSLPFQSGPWLLNGLPGLIIDAYDENKSIHFQFAGFENANEGDFKRIVDITKRPNADPGDINAIDIGLGRDIASAYFSNTIKVPSHATKTTKTALDKFKAALEKDKRKTQKK